MKKSKNSFLIVITVAMIFAGFNLSALAHNDLGRLNPVKVGVSCDEFKMKKDVSKSVRIAEHGRLEVTLCSNPSTGYEWSDSAQISNHSVLWQTEHTTSSSSSGTLGSPTETKWVFRALDEGKSTISLEYGRSWQANGEDNWSLSLQVNVIDEDDIDQRDSNETDGKSTGEKLVRNLFNLINQPNFTALKGQISDKFQGVSESGSNTRKDELKVLRDSELDDYKLSDFNSTRRNDTLVVTYKLRAEKTVLGEEAENEPVNQLSVFVKTDSGWEWIAHASTS